jgi:transcription initiation factor IIE alpha subunit
MKVKKPSLNVFMTQSVSSKLAVFRDVSPAQAEREVIEHLEKHSGVFWPDEMAEELGIDYRLVLKVVQQLTGEGKVEVVEKKRKR